MHSADHDDAVAARILEILRQCVGKFAEFQFDPDSKQLILGRMQDFDFGLISLETFPIHILKMLVPGWLIGEIYDLRPFEDKVQTVMREWYVQKTAALKNFAELPDSYSDDKR
jgi:hypothetical protein